MKTELQEHAFKNRLIIWGRGVNTDVFNSSQRVEQEYPYLLYVGRITVEKNIEAFLSLDLPYKKVVVGDGPLLDYYKTKYPEVFFEGSKTGVELAWYYANASCFVFPSLTDTLGIVQLEAIAAGVPVAGYDASGVRDVVINGLTGWYGDDLKDSIIKCLKLDRSLVEAQARVYTWGACTKIFLKSLITI